MATITIKSDAPVPREPFMRGTHQVKTSMHVQASNGRLVMTRVVVMAVVMTEKIVAVAVQRRQLRSVVCAGVCVGVDTS